MLRKLALVLFCLLPVFCHAQPLKLEYGVNKVDINADGVDDLIVRTRWENFNAHSFDRYVIAITSKNSEVYEVPLGQAADYRIQTDEGAECLRVGFAFRLDSKRMMEVVRYKLGEGLQTYCEASNMTTTTYKIEASDGDVGLPYFYLKQIKEERSSKLYESVEEFL